MTTVGASGNNGNWLPGRVGVVGLTLFPTNQTCRLHGDPSSRRLFFDVFYSGVLPGDVLLIAAARQINNNASVGL